ncbi:hypothetical protein [Streptomyces sp. NPDC088915]|uniref:hypothetical protein n=1 Tax=Streptomyces sp. NPDC088915 TaxID=3365912 RepID=UPI003819AD23
MGGFLYVLGAVLIVVGCLAPVLTTGNFLAWSKAGKLRRHGIEGEAVSVLNDWMEGKPRVHYRVCLPDPDEDRRFYATQLTEPDPVGTTSTVVYDRRRPTRAMVGAMEKVDATHRSEGGVVKFVTVFALCTLLPGCALVALFP